MKPLRNLLPLAAIVWTGCGVMHFQNGETTAQPQERSKWRHNLAFGMLEPSRPVDVARLCPGGWSEITTQLTFTDVVLGSVDNLATFPVFPGGLDFWQPQTVKYRCRE